MWRSYRGGIIMRACAGVCQILIKGNQRVVTGVHSISAATTNRGCNLEYNHQGFC